MEIHNLTEDIVFATVAEICDAIERGENPDNICTCNQCRIDTACYVLNRSIPHYIVSNRGVARAEQETIERQQKEADTIALVYEALKRVNHNQRPFFSHAHIRDKQHKNSSSAVSIPVFNIPTIVGRLFNGLNFAPMSDVKVELHREGDLVAMKDQNWQNPYNLVQNIGGTFTFWPEPIPADSAGIHKIFEYSVKIESPGFEELSHVFRIPVISEIQTADTFSPERIFKLPDLYMFPPGEGEDE
jgi:competence protein ComFB